MPESPEVQSLVETARARLVGREIRAVEVLDREQYKTGTVSPALLQGARILDVRRFGKYVDVDMGERHLVIGFGLGGWLVWHRGADGSEPRTSGLVRGPASIARVVLDDGDGFDVRDSLRFHSATLWIVADVQEVPAVRKLGPDPLSPSYARADFDRVFVGRRKQLKAVLQEQESLAGIGNAYSDEILFAARLSPVVRASTLSDDELDRLYDALLAVPRGAVQARRGIPIDRLKEAKVVAMAVHGRAGEACPVCGEPVRDFPFAGSVAQYCPRCQTGGEPIQR
jgi:formamidopyrimidine-DNA glycosylase